MTQVGLIRIAELLSTRPSQEYRVEVMRHEGGTNVMTRDFVMTSVQLDGQPWMTSLEQKGGTST